MKALVAGWFSFSDGHATAGDLLAAHVLCDWLSVSDCPFDIAVAPPFKGGLDWRVATAQEYSHVVFVCGPFPDTDTSRRFLAHFSTCKMIGLNLSMLRPIDQWNPFDVLIERDSSAAVRPDLAFLTNAPRVPIVGVCLVEPYGAPFENAAYDAITRLLFSREASIVNIDTRLDTNSTGLRTPSEIESLIARMDMIVTTRLHGTVLALKNGVPCISIDPGGDNSKIKKQADRIGWPLVFTGGNLSDTALNQAFDFCLTEPARAQARACAEHARAFGPNTFEDLRAALGLTLGQAAEALARIHTQSVENRISVRLDARVPWADGELTKVRQEHWIYRRPSRALKAILPDTVNSWLRRYFRRGS